MNSIQLYSFRPKQKISKWVANGMSAKGCVPYNALIVSITKFSIVIGCLRACLARNWRGIRWLSNYSCNNIHENITVSHWPRAVQFKCNTNTKSVTPVQITHRNFGL